ncbi:MAG: pyrroline-5-carboxylate reductase [Armatimonadetes bacterium]|nr:pyrroline-5-carboxylate reductase [Armatimonadota bacterium]
MSKEFQLGLIGAGVMGSALVRAAVSAGVVEGHQIVAYDPDTPRLQALCEDTGAVPAASNAELVAAADAVLLAVKPQAVGDVLGPLGFRSEQLLISIAAGVPIARLKALTGAEQPIARVMPNILCIVRAAASAVVFSPEVSQSQRAFCRSLLGAAGMVVEVEETLMDAVTGLSGSGPAFVALVIEALADGGVRAGLPRDQALRLAAQTVAGTGKYVLETNELPAALKDRVCSPAGTTIEGIAELEQAGVRSAFIEAVTRAARRSAELGKG